MIVLFLEVILALCVLISAALHPVTPEEIALHPTFVHATQLYGQEMPLVAPLQFVVTLQQQFVMVDIVFHLECAAVMEPTTLKLVQ